MLKVADKALFDAQIIQKLQGDPGILRGNKIRLLQCLPATDGDVPQITDRCGDEIQHACHKNLLEMI
jgi:hypothetical protein